MNARFALSFDALLVALGAVVACDARAVDAGAAVANVDSDAGDAGAPGMPLASVGSFVVLGDSINVTGGNFGGFPNLLDKNDDAAFPSFRGHDLQTRYGAVRFIVAAVPGSLTSDLAGQIAGLPATLPGPVVVSIVSGGNDLQSNAVDLVEGNAMQATNAMKTNIAAALDALTAAGRFGAGVDVHVYETDVYDPTDGQGNFAKCGLSVDIPSDGIFAKWNGAIAEAVAGRPNVELLSLHDAFRGHGINNTTDTWFNGCVHPNEQGANEIRHLFWKAFTGEDVSILEPAYDAGPQYCSQPDAGFSGPPGTCNGSPCAAGSVCAQNLGSVICFAMPFKGVGTRCIPDACGTIQCGCACTDAVRGTCECTPDGG